ncbi:cytochrome P450 monooxygenase [Penicillium malachiteum]|nr:cytochrome P450 monooxygenase [Penicillium malachiteum]
MAVVLKHCFGMSQKAVDTYLHDTSGCRAQSIPGSHVRWSGRASYYTHKSLVEGLLGEGVAPLIERVESLFRSELEDAVPISSEWTYEWDLTDFLQEHLSSAILQALYGPLLIRQDDEFISKLWKYDNGIMSLMRRLPRWMVPEMYRYRDDLVDSIMRWHHQAVQLSESDIRGTYGPQPDGFDAYWGTTMMRDRYKTLLAMDGQDPRSVASTDLAFIWAYVSPRLHPTTSLKDISSSQANQIY